MLHSNQVVQLKWFLLAAIGSSSLALAQPVARAEETHFRMQRSAEVEQVLTNQDGEPFALVLAEGSVVMLSSKAAEHGYAAGQRVQVEGDAVETPINVVYYRARITRGGRLLQAADEQLAEQPKADSCAEDRLTVQGRITAFLASPNGQLTGLVLSDGVVALADGRLDPAGMIRGSELEVSGPSRQLESGMVVRIEKVAMIRPAWPNTVSAASLR